MSNSRSQNFPTFNDEPPRKLEVYGRNEADHVVVDGWSNDMPVKFPGINPTFQVKNIEAVYLDSGTPTTDKIFTELKGRQFITLKDLAQSASSSFQTNLRPIEAYVIAKKKIVFLVKNEYVLLFGEILVADSTGCVLLKCGTDCIPILYENVSVGDRLLIGHASYTLGHEIELHDFLPGFNENILHNFNLKVNVYQCRKLFKIIQNHQPYEIPRHFLEGDYRGLKSPSILEQNPDLFNRPDSDHQDHKHELIDLIGIISYVSRAERSRRYESMCHELSSGTGTGRGSTIAALLQYNICQWIEIIDKDSRNPLPIKIYINNNTIPAQGKLVPGNLIILTHMESGPSEYGYQYFTTSRISTIYINSEVQDYLNFMPNDPEYQSLVKQMQNPQVGRLTLQRSNITWAVGGYYPEPIRSESAFTDLYENRHNNLYRSPKLPLNRRETQYLYFKGVILSHKLIDVDKKENPSWHYRNLELIARFPMSYSTMSKALTRNFMPENPSSNCWFPFQRKLPQLDYNQIVGGSSALKFYDISLLTNSKYIGTLGMPSDGTDDLKSLELAHGSQHYILEILNLDIDASTRDTQGRYFALWIPSRNLSLQSMQNKLELSKGNHILIQMNIHRAEIDPEDSESAKGYEFYVQDFTTENYVG